MGGTPEKNKIFISISERMLNIFVFLAVLLRQPKISQISKLQGEQEGARVCKMVVRFPNPLATGSGLGAQYP